MNILSAKIRGLHWSQWLSVLGLAVLFVALRWNNFNAPLIRDEGEYAYAAQLMIQGVAPYQHAFIQKPPGIVYSYALANLLLPQFFWSPRLLAYLFVALATVLLGFIAWLEFGEGFALPAMWLMTAMVPLPMVDQYSVNTEMFMLLPLLATVAVYCYGRQHGNKNQHWFFAGFLATATLLYKYTAAPMVAFVFVSWVAEMHWSRQGSGSICKALGFAAAGGVLACALELGFFMAHGALKQLWECTLVFNRYYPAASNDFAPAYLWARLEMFWDYWWILFLIPCAILLEPRRRVLFWLGIFICAAFATSGSCYLQYYIAMMPFWALLNAVGIQAIFSRVSKWMQKPVLWLATLIAAVVVALVVRPDMPWILCPGEQFVVKKMEGVLPFVEARFVAGQVSQITSPDDFVYVAGSEPEILCYAHRFSPTRFITSYSLMIPTPLALRYQQEVINDLGEHFPKAIVFPQTGDSWMRFSTTPTNLLDFMGKFLSRNYERVGGYVKSSGQNGYWSTNLTYSEFRASSLVLYKLKTLDASHDP